jgi:hypothetical protein
MTNIKGTNCFFQMVFLVLYMFNKGSELEPSEPQPCIAMWIRLLAAPASITGEFACLSFEL